MSTSYKDIVAAITSRVESNLTSIDSGYSATVDVAWPNVDFAADNLADWMSVDVQFTGARQAAVGSTGRRIDGALVLGFFAQRTDGLNELQTRVDNAADLFAAGTSVTSGSTTVRFRTPQAVTPDPNVAEWCRQILTCPFTVYT